MQFDSREQFVKSQESEKIVLAHVNATSRLVVWTDEGGGVYSKDVNYFVVGMAQDELAFTQTSSIPAAVNEFYYSPLLGRVYINTATAPDSVDTIATYRFFFSNVTTDIPYDLTDTGTNVLYQGRILKSPGYKQKIGIDQNLTSLVGKGTLSINSNDGFFDDKYDRLYFDNQTVDVYSWNRTLPASTAVKIFRGRITDKTFSSDSVSFNIKDDLFDLSGNIPQGLFQSSDGVNDAAIGTYKRWVYGRADGVKLQSIDQIGDGYDITGTITAGNVGEWNAATNVPQLSNTTGILGQQFEVTASGSVDFGAGSISFNDGDYAVFTGSVWTKFTRGPILLGTGTSFLSELSPDDELTIGTQNFSVEFVESNTAVAVSDPPRFGIANLGASVVPSIPTTTKNRTFFVTDHPGAELTKTLTNIVQFNRVELSDTDGLLVGDFLEFSTAERVEIKRVDPGNIVVLQQSLTTLPPVSSSVFRRPIQDLFIETRRINSDDFTVSNTTELTVTIDSDAEFNLSRNRLVNGNFTFTNGSRVVTITGIDDASSLFKPRDFIRPADVTYTAFYEVLQVEDNNIYIRTTFSDPTITDSCTLRSPSYVGDNTIVSADVLGRTEDGTASGTWISTASQAVKDILTQANLTDNINVASFTDATSKQTQVVSLTIPESPGSQSTSFKAAIDKLNKSTLSAQTLDNNLNLKYVQLMPSIPDDIPVITDRETVKWSIRTVSSKLFSDVILRYRFKDVDRFTLEPGNNLATFTSDFVNRYIKAKKTSEFDLYLYDQVDAEIRSHREAYTHRLGRTELVIDTDLRLESLEIGDPVKVQFDRLYTRLGSGLDTDKILIIVGKTVTGESTQIVLTDLGNNFNSSSIITPNSAVDFASASAEDKIKYGYITDANGVVEDDEETSQIHLIS